MFSFSPEFTLTIIIQLISIGIFIGIFKTTISFMQEQIKDLKEEMKKYNSVLERMIIVEQSTKAAHHREDELNQRVIKLEQK